MLKVVNWWRMLQISNKISLIGVASAVMFSVISLVKSCHQDEVIGDLGYQMNSVSFQPRIIVVGKPKLIKYRMRSTPTKIAVKDILWPDSTKSEPKYFMKTIDSLTFKLRIVNVGHSIGKVIGIFVGDTTSAEEMIRQKLLSGAVDRFGSKSFSSYVQNELLPDAADTLDYELENVVHWLDDQLFTVHFLMLYENDLGHLYDTYYWAQFRFEGIPVRSPFFVRDGRLIMKSEQTVMVALADIAKQVRDKTSFKTYSADDAKLVRNSLDILLKRLKKESK